MAEALEQQDTVTLEELAISNSFELAAMFNILERRGLISKSELVEELKRLRSEH